MNKVIPPKHLSQSSKDLFKKILDEYIIDDSPSLKILIVGLEALDRANKARRRIDKDGMVFIGRFEQPKPHPLLPIERDSRAQFINAIKALNLDFEGVSREAQ